jgi:exopolysaccharide production protein ExoQ
MEINISQKPISLSKFESIFIVILLILSTGGGGLPLISSLRQNENFAGDSLVQIVWSAMYVVTFILILRHWRVIKPHILKNIPIIFLTGLAFLSSLWSINPELSIRRSIALLGTTLVGFYLGAKCNIQDLLKYTLLALVFCAVLSFIVVIFLPDIGLQYYEEGFVWRGIYGHKNHFGRIMFFAMLISYIISIQKKKSLRAWLITLSALFAGLLFASKSTTAIVILCFMGAIIPVFKFNKIDYRLKGVFLSIVLATLILSTVLILNMSITVIDNLFRQFLGKDITLGGRTLIWSMCWPYIKESFFLGYGYNVFWTESSGPAEIIRKVMNINVAHGHNGVIDLLLQLGVVGLGLFLIVFYQYISRTIRNFKARVYFNKSEYLFPIFFIFCFVGLNIAESMILKKNYFFWILFIALMVSMNSLRTGNNIIYKNSY